MSERTEIIEGERYTSPAATGEHQQIVERVASLLKPFVGDNQLGEVLQAPVEVTFQDGDAVQPDLVFVSGERAHIVTERRVEAAPDVIVEVVSNATSTIDYQLKRARYAHFQVPEYWIVDPLKRELAIWTPQNRLRPRLCLSGDESFTWEPHPGGPTLAIRVSELWQDAD